MEFTLNKELPTQKEIGQKLERASILLKLYVWGFRLCFTAVGIIFLFLFPFNNAVIPLLLMSAMVVGIFFVIKAGEAWDKKRGMSCIDDSFYCDKILEFCNKYPEIDQYRRKVISSGRKLTNAEYNMMYEWVSNIQETAPCKKLYRPSLND